jgi:hypothetical protein
MNSAAPLAANTTISARKLLVSTWLVAANISLAVVFETFDIVIGKLTVLSANITGDGTGDGIGDGTGDGSGVGTGVGIGVGSGVGASVRLNALCECEFRWATQTDSVPLRVVTCYRHVVAELHEAREFKIRIPSAPDARVGRSSTEACKTHSTSTSTRSPHAAFAEKVPTNAPCPAMLARKSNTSSDVLLFKGTSMRSATS